MTDELKHTPEEIKDRLSNIGEAIGSIALEYIAELEAQIEKMKCGGNCKFEYWKNTGGCYDQKCRFTGLDCTNCKDKWKGKWEDD